MQKCNCTREKCTVNDLMLASPVIAWQLDSEVEETEVERKGRAKRIIGKYNPIFY